MQGEEAAPSAEAAPAAEGDEAKKEEPKQENPGDKDELWCVPGSTCCLTDLVEKRNFDEHGQCQQLNSENTTVAHA